MVPAWLGVRRFCPAFHLLDNSRFNGSTDFSWKGDPSAGRVVLQVKKDNRKQA